MKCTICNADNLLNTKYCVREMTYGSREEFEYYQCSNCKALQIHFVPPNISKYYESYYTQKKGYTKISTIKKLLWGMRSSLALTKLYPFIEFIRYNSILHWAHISGINKHCRILDVGCGNGDVLYEFSKHGFKNLVGIDPYLENTKLQGIELLKCDLLSYQSELKYDLIMFNHSFEHLSEHHATLSKAMMLLSKNGTIMIRTPVINKVFELYKENWVQIDAPRHLIIHSLRSMRILCEMNDAVVYNDYFDSFSLQFLGSEQIKQDIFLYAPNSYKVNIDKSIFTREDIQKYEEKAKRFNKDRLGDQAVFFIRRKGGSKI